MGKSRILLIGDSIRMHYTPLVWKKLKDVAEILIIDENCQDSQKIRQNLAKWLDQFGKKTIDIVHFNCGLHDIKREFGSDENQVPITQYKENLRFIVDYLQKNTDATLIWATTTPVITELHHKNKPFDRFLDDVKYYNEIAAEIMKQASIPVNDLFSVIDGPKIKKYIKKDGVHCKRKGNRLVSTQVARFLKKYIY